jgi:hypothetical protein
MKKFTIPCTFGDKTAPFDVYIGNPKGGHHPLQHQAGWLSKERGGSIPAEVMESFGKLLDLAEKHNVAYEELCVYALNEANKKKEADAAAATNGGEGGAEVAVPPLGTPQMDGIKISDE